MCKHGDTMVLVVGNKRFDVDRCIHPLVAALNQAGFYTVASCCGHGYRPGRIALADGRELHLSPDFETANRIDALFPLDIHGEPRSAEGWQCVPREPTKEMLDAGVDHNPTVFNFGTERGFARDVANDVYRAMLAASPAAPAAGAERRGRISDEGRHHG